MRKKKDSPKIKEIKHQARRRSIKEGIFSRIKESLGYNYISPFAIAVNTSNSMIAMIGSIVGLLGPMSQMFGSRLMEKFSRKKIVRRAVLFEALMWIPFIILAYLYYKGIITTIIPTLVLFAFAMYTIFSHIHYPAWFSWMGDLVDEEYRGRWFSKRNLITGFVLIVFTIGAAVFLDYFKNKGLVMQGFMILFGIAMLSRLISWRLLKTQYEPRIKIKKDSYFSFWDFTINAHKNNFGRFSIFRAFLGFSANISSVFIAVYLLRYLEFTYVTYMIVILSGTLFAIMVMGLWGKFADKYGNYKTMCITTIAIPTIPILWILHPSPIYLILVPSLIGGTAWAGFNLAVNNYIYDNVTPQKRGICVSYNNMLQGIGLFFGAGLGAILIKYITITSIEPLFIIFGISALIRMVVVFISIPKLKETRKMKKFKSKTVLKNLVLKEGPSTLSEEAHQIMSIGDYLSD